jgi:hypothetical protein
MAEKSLQPAVSASRLGVSSLRPGTLQITLRQGVEITDLHMVIDRITDLNGCRSCGLNGIDVLWRIQDPFIVDRFADIKSVSDVVLHR